MIIQTGNRTDIPAFYSEWFANRLREGFVLVRNPYNFQAVTSYALNPDVVDLIVFCSKNPAPMFPYMDLLKPYGQYWFVTITPYGKDIEPNVPDKAFVMDASCQLSDLVGINRHIQHMRSSVPLLLCQYRPEYYSSKHEVARSKVSVPARGLLSGRYRAPGKAGKLD